MVHIFLLSVGISAVVTSRPCKPCGSFSQFRRGCRFDILLCRSLRRHRCHLRCKSHRRSQHRCHDHPGDPRLHTNQLPKNQWRMGICMRTMGGGPAVLEGAAACLQQHPAGGVSSPTPGIGDPSDDARSSCWRALALDAFAAHTREPSSKTSGRRPRDLRCQESC
jgi:hypothetical protein